MTPLVLSDVSAYVEENIGTFHQKRIATLNNLSLSRVLKRKNPYLFKAKSVQTAQEIVKGLVDAHISSNEETVLATGLKGWPFLSTARFMADGNQVSPELTLSLTGMANAALSTSSPGRTGETAARLPK